MEAANKLERAANSKKAVMAILVRTRKGDLFLKAQLPKFIKLVDSTALHITDEIAEVINNIIIEDLDKMVHNAEKVRLV